MRDLTLFCIRLRRAFHQLSGRSVRALRCTFDLSAGWLSIGPLRFNAASEAQPFANLYYTVELPGVYKYIGLTSYAPGQTFSADEEQYRWLEAELQKVCGALTKGRAAQEQGR